MYITFNVQQYHKIVFRWCFLEVKINVRQIQLILTKKSSLFLRKNNFECFVLVTSWIRGGKNSLVRCHLFFWAADGSVHPRWTSTSRPLKSDPVHWFKQGSGCSTAVDILSHRPQGSWCGFSYLNGEQLNLRLLKACDAVSDNKQHSPRVNRGELFAVTHTVMQQMFVPTSPSPVPSAVIMHALSFGGESTFIGRLDVIKCTLLSKMHT